MTISDANWTASTDPYRASDVVINTPTWDTGAENFQVQTVGTINAIHDDPDVQRAFLKETSSPWSELDLDGWQKDITGFNQANFEFSSDGIKDNYAALYGVGTSAAWDYGRYRNSTQGGAFTYGLAIETGYWWAGRNPAQVIMAMLHHYLPDTFGGNGLRDFMSKSSFQAASADFSIIAPSTNTYELPVWRIVGKSIKGQVEDILRQTVDWMGVRPDETTGVAQLHYIRRDAPNEIDTTVDFDNVNEGIRSVRGGIDDSLRIYQIDFKYGKVITSETIPANVGLWDNFTYAPRYGATPDLSHEEWKFSLVRRSGKVPLAINLPDCEHRWMIERHWQMMYWAWEQQDITFDHGPRNFNYEVGDVITINSRKFGLDGTQKFLVYEKEIDYSSLQAKVRVLRVYGLSGTRPDRLSNVARSELIWHHKSEGLADQPDGALAHRFTSSYMRKNQRFESWLDSAADTGTALKAGVAATADGTGEVLRDGDANSLNGWPVLDFTDAVTGQGMDQEVGFSTTVDKLLVFVIKHKTGTYSNDEYLIRATNGGGADTAVFLYDGTYSSSKLSANGGFTGSGQLLGDTSWHVVIVQIGDSANASYFREDDTVLSTFTATGSGALLDTEAFLFSWNGDAILNAEVYVAECFLYQNATVLTSGEVDALVAHYREKFRFDE